ncbi:MAG: alanine--glyoxylate aminotransferase family protein [Candidatus Bathyarchaeia archaeon]|jgi:aspartate aminotransferase-like enzyme
MSERKLLMIPGPTNVDPMVLRALGRPTLAHTDPQFVEAFKEALENLKKVFMTKREAFVIAGSGTLALEIGVANIIEPGDKILNAVTGYFGDYFVKISKAHGAACKTLEAPWGKRVEPDQVKAALKEDDYKAVTVTHVDTSTGVTNPIREIGQIVKENSDAFYVVDTVCSLGGMEVRVDDWNIDACVSGSQKCIGLPPGLALLSISDRVLNLLENRKTPVGLWYGDLKNWLPIMRDPAKYFATPPVNMIYALSESLKAILAEGLEPRFRRHHIIAEAIRAAIEALNIKLVTDRKCTADTLTVAYYPENIEDMSFRSEMRKRGVVVASTIGPIKGKGFRIGHMGNVDENDVLSTIGVIETTLTHLGYKFSLGAGLAAAQSKLVPL